MIHRLRSTRLRARATGEQAGFTLVELLVVMTILGLLAAIGIPAFLSQREKSMDVDAKHAAGVAGRAAETIAVSNDGRYDGPEGVTVPNLRQVEPTLGDSNMEVLEATASRYTIRMTANTGHTFTYTRDSGSIETSCEPEGEGGCPEGGSWD